MGSTGQYFVMGGTRQYLCLECDITLSVINYTVLFVSFPPP